jgi:hypothetical protein
VGSLKMPQVAYFRLSKLLIGIPGKRSPGST